MGPCIKGKHFNPLSINLEQVLKTGSLQDVLNAGASSSPTCVSKRFQWSRCNPGCLIDEGHCTTHKGINGLCKMVDRTYISFCFVIVALLFFLLLHTAFSNNTPKKAIKICIRKNSYLLVPAVNQFFRIQT